MIKIDIKPLSVNWAYKWKKIKTKALIEYKEELDNIITLEIWEDHFNYIDFEKKWLALKLNIVWWFSSMWSDVDNPLKPFIDALQESLWFNDNIVYELNVKKTKTKKEEEFILFEIEEVSSSNYKIENFNI